MRVASLGLVALLLAASTGADAALWRRHADRSTATAARSPSSQHVLCHPAAQLSRGLPSLLLASLEPYRPRPRRADLASKLFAANLACFVLVRGRAFPYLVKSNAALRRGQLHRLVSSCFLHGGPLHLAVNCASLRNVGPVVETFFGSERFLATYLGAGISGNLLSWGLGRAPTSVGASGAIFGLVGAWAVFLVRNQRVLEEYGFRNIDAQLKSIMQLSLVNARVPYRQLWTCGRLPRWCARLGALRAEAVQAREPHARLPLGRLPASRTAKAAAETEAPWAAPNNLSVHDA